MSPEEGKRGLAGLLDQLLAITRAEAPVLWSYTPQMRAFSRHAAARAVVCDCMDELSAFGFAPPDLAANEARLMAEADVVFTGGPSLWEARRDRHDNIHAFLSSVDAAHFAAARTPRADPPDQAVIPHPQLGYYGVIDERLDLGLIRNVARARPDWQVVMVGPVAKLAEADLPRAANIHWLGRKSYDDLPVYLAGWDVALMPFAINDATRFISPTKTSEYLAAGRPAVSTPVRDVIRHYGDVTAVRIADGPKAFVAACDAALEIASAPGAWRDEVDRRLATLCWDATNRHTTRLVTEAAWARGNLRASAAAPAPAMSRSPARASRVPSWPSSWPRDRGGGCSSWTGGRTSRATPATITTRPESSFTVTGPHIFHTKSDAVVNYLSRFTRWRPYDHRVLAHVDDALLPVPINRTSVKALYGLSLGTDAEVAAYLAQQAEPVAEIRTARDVIVNAVGTRLYERFFRGDTRKQWGLDPSDLDASVTARVPTRTSDDDRYFGDAFQAMPAEGYTRMFERMLDHPLIDLALGQDFHDLSKCRPHPAHRL